MLTAISAVVSTHISCCAAPAPARAAVPSLATMAVSTRPSSVWSAFSPIAGQARRNTLCPTSRRSSRELCFTYFSARRSDHFAQRHTLGLSSGLDAQAATCKSPRCLCDLHSRFLCGFTLDDLPATGNMFAAR